MIIDLMIIFIVFELACVIGGIVLGLRIRAQQERDRNE
jgi:hypothetical protein